MNPLKAGDIAPKFSLPDQDGEQVNLADFQGQRVLVYFYPKAMTPGCTVQACGLRDNMDDLKSAGDMSDNFFQASVLIVGITGGRFCRNDMRSHSPFL
jgi:peroxiredoxin